MNCIVCRKEIFPLPDMGGELNPDYVEPPNMDEYVNNTNWNDATVDFIYPGYGSSHDTDKMRIAVCDECVTNRLADGTIQNCGNYLFPDRPKK